MGVALKYVIIKHIQTKIFYFVTNIKFISLKSTTFCTSQKYEKYNEMN